MADTSKNNKNNIVMKWFPLAVLAVASAIAWGAQQNIVTEHERRIIKNEILLQELRTGQSRIDERTLLMHENIKENKMILLKILQNGEKR